jgi:hypothetical protein
MSFEGGGQYEKWAEKQAEIVKENEEKRCKMNIEIQRYRKKTANGKILYNRRKISENKHKKCE